MIYNNILENGILPVGDQLVGGKFMHYLRQYRRLSTALPEELHRLQRERLEQLLERAQENSSYYQRRSGAHKSDPYEWLLQFPTLTKNDLRSHLEDIVTLENTKGLEKLVSSGTTGLPSVVYCTGGELSVPRAVQTMWWEWSGYQIGNSILQTGISTDRTPVKAVKDILFRTRYVQAFEHAPDKIRQELEYVRRHPKDHFFGYASSLYLFAKEAVEHDIRDIRFKSVSSWGESMLPEFRQTIEEIFHTKVFDTYGASEGLMMAGQCEAGNYHLSTPHVYLEILRADGTPVEEGEIGKVVVTSLTNLTTPLIRYEVGDMMRRETKGLCACGRTLPIAGRIVGRSSELLTTPGGRYITVPAVVAIMKYFNQLEEYQMVQEKKDKFVLRVVPGVPLETSEKERMVQKYQEYLGERIDLEIRCVDKVPRAPSGKLQLVKNETIGR